MKRAFGFTPLESPVPLQRGFVTGPAIYSGDEIYKISLPYPIRNGISRRDVSNRAYRKGGVKAPSFLTGFTLIEVVICVIIIAVLSSLTVAGLSKYIETTAEKKAKLNLKIVWDDEKDFYAFRGRYTDEWNLLSIARPLDERYNYKITKAAHDELEIKAIPKIKGKGFLIDTEGKISEF